MVKAPRVHIIVTIIALLFHGAAAVSAFAAAPGGTTPPAAEAASATGVGEASFTTLAGARAASQTSQTSQTSHTSLTPLASFTSFADAAVLHPDLPRLAQLRFTLAEGDELLSVQSMEDPAAAAKGAEAGRKDEWPWRKGGTAEYAIFSAAALAAIYFELDAKGSDESKWTSRNGFDESIRDALRLGSRDARDAAHITGTVIMGIMIAAPILEPLATLGFRDARWERQWRTQLINAESFAFTSFFSSMLQNYVARERPFVRNCTPGDCEGHLENRSFPSGHVAFEYTGAGLLCNHHQYQTFYEDPSTGRMVCATGIGLAVADSFLRVISDRHYATDVLMGAAIGLFSGFVLPRWLHYDKPREDADLERGGKEPQVKLIGFAPQLLNKGATLSCAFSY